jgi:hypothetical protein
MTLIAGNQQHISSYIQIYIIFIFDSLQILQTYLNVEGKTENPVNDDHSCHYPWRCQCFPHCAETALER